MNLSPPVSAGPTGLMEPPLSPGAPAVAPAPGPTRSIEAEMVRMGLMTPDEVAATMREESETGRPFTELAVERGHVSAEHMAKIAKPVLPPVQRETQPAPPEQRAPIFADTVLPPANPASAPVEPLLPPPPPAEPEPVAEQAVQQPVEAPEPEPSPVAPEPETIAVEPEPVAVAPEPIPAAPDPEPVHAVEPVAASEPEPIAAAPPPVVVAEPEPVVAAEPEPVVAAEPEPVVAAEPEPVVAAEPEPGVEPMPEPVVAVEPEPVVEPMPEPEPVVQEPPTAVAEARAPVTPAAVQAALVTAHVFVRLSNGERIAAGSFDNEYGAEQCAQELMAAIDTPGSWPRVDGRFVRPDAILSIDLELNGI